MNKLPTKQIYLLAIIVMGIITLSIYSTYAIFTFEGETSNIISVNTPNSLKVTEEISEYQQVSVPKNSFIKVDIDIYNTYKYELCYSLWYQIVGDNIDSSLVKVYQNSTSSSGVALVGENVRLNILITNDNDEDVIVNIGLASAKNGETCSLNISKDKNLITLSLDSSKVLTEVVNNEKEITEKEGYLIYKDKIGSIELLSDQDFYISDDFTYHNEKFILNNPIKVSANEILEYSTFPDKKYYTCLTKNTCQFLYGINSIEKSESKLEDKYVITKYDLLKGYLETESGVKKVSNNNYYYGDNPRNYLYYNCSNQQDVKSCELWRIVGTIYDSKQKQYLTQIIRDDSIGLLTYNDIDSNIWHTSTLSKYLNTDYKLYNTDYLYEYSYTPEYITSLSVDISNIGKFDQVDNNKVSIINLSNYLIASSCTYNTIGSYNEACLKNNWLNINDMPTYTMTALKDELIMPDSNNLQLKETKIPVLNNKVWAVSNTIKEVTVDNKLNVRPVVYLKPRILVVGGDGTLDKPYIIR